MQLDRIEIRQSKRKLVIGFLGCIGFVALGIFLITIRDEQDSRDPILVVVAGIASIAFFGAGAVMLFFKLFDNKPVLILDEQGLSVDTTATGKNFIAWSQITGMRTELVATTRFLVILLADPEEYMAHAKGLKKRIMKGNLKAYGTPVVIASNSLQCSFAELKRLIETRWLVYTEGQAKNK